MQKLPPEEPENFANEPAESLIIETTADDTPVMEIYQADMVAKEVAIEEPESGGISLVRSLRTWLRGAVSTLASGSAR